MPDKPFYISPEGTGHFSSLTSFLCTDAAFEIFDAGGTTFQNTQVAKYPDFKPIDNPKVLTNSGVIANIKRFFGYAVTEGHGARRITCSWGERSTLTSRYSTMP